MHEVGVRVRVRVGVTVGVSVGCRRQFMILYIFANDYISDVIG